MTAYADTNASTLRTQTDDMRCETSVSPEQIDEGARGCVHTHVVVGGDEV